MVYVLHPHEYSKRSLPPPWLLVLQQVTVPAAPSWQEARGYSSPNASTPWLMTACLWSASNMVACEY